MNRRPPSSLHSLVVNLCIVATLWNLPSPLRATPAREVSRSADLGQNLFVLLEEHPEESNSEEGVYTLTLRNLSDQEIVLDDLQVRSPDSPYPAQILPIAEGDDELEQAPHLDDRNRSRPSPYPSYYSPGFTGPSRCDEACVIFVVILVVLIVGIIVIAVAEENRKKREREVAEAKAREEAKRVVKGSIRLLRHQETSRKIVIPKDSGRSIHEVVIELNDQVRQQRVFKAEMGGRPST